MTSASRQVLIVDDEPDIRDSVADILNEFGYKADTAADGPEALSMVRDRSYDVALLDFKMPDMDGLTLYREMRHICPETSAILVSAYTGDAVAQEAISSGIRKIIPRPVDMDDVIAEVKRQLDRPVVLVIDDDSDFCESIRDVLNEWGFRVSLAGDEAAAARLLNSRQPQVVLLDIVLGPGSNTARVFQRIRGASPNAGIVLITGHRLDTAPTIMDLTSAGAATVCYKPLEPDQLLSVLQELV
ncbi:response regulator [bacterium]|nr:response regulator [bacterium]